MKKNFAADARTAIKSNDREQIRKVVKEMNAATEAKRARQKSGRFGL